MPPRRPVARASPDGHDGSVKVHQDTRLYTALLDEGQRVTHPIAAGRHAWLQVVAGSVEIDGARLSAGDGAAVSDETQLTIEARSDAHLLLFDLA